MGIVYSYLYTTEVAQQEEEDTKLSKESSSDSNYTILYPQHEREYLKQLEAEAKRQAASFKFTSTIPADVWANMTQSEKERYMKQRGARHKLRRKEKERNRELQIKRQEIQSWIDELSPKQRANIKEVVWKTPNDDTLQEYLKQQRNKLIVCANKFCGLPFEKIDVDSKKKAPLVLGENGKPLSPEALENFLDNRFRCFHCETVFCVACGAIPYHLGETCDQYKERTTHPPCRVCKIPLPTPPDNAAKREICFNEECIKMVYNLCTAQTTCKHPCSGIKGIPCFCLKESCIASQKLTQHGGDFCNICYTDELDAGTCIMLTCGHVFHRHCLEQKLKHRWTGARISFTYAACPLCQKPIEPTGDYSINMLLTSTKDLRNDVKLKAIHFLKAEGMMQDIKDPKHKYYNNPLDYALTIFSFYLCHKCKSPYYGGKRQCGDILDFNPEELICGGCSGMVSCDKADHGRKFIQYKCRFCCSVASWFCFGRVHYCENCHNDPYKYWAPNNVLSSVPPQCEGKDKCPLGIEHPPNGFEEMSLGCSKCALEASGMALEDFECEDELDDDFYEEEDDM
eukprot:Phypoly_transcript_05224.p1 GENE.Phypoly_transcript_05224~~Phypoly_transcript_05224.p1  ORF type:complete len:588 (+),score=70.15 Phypoly_transcript_05224:60-1766(+)